MRISLFCAYQRKFSPRLFEGSVDTVGTSEQYTKYFSAKFHFSTNSQKFSLTFLMDNTVVILLPFLLLVRISILTLSLQTQVQGACRPGGVGGDTVLKFWLNILLSWPTWVREKSVLLLLDTLCMAAFKEGAWQEIIMERMMENYRVSGALLIKGVSPRTKTKQLTVGFNDTLEHSLGLEFQTPPFSLMFTCTCV